MTKIKNDLLKTYLVNDRTINGPGEVERLAVKAKISPTRLRILIKGNLDHVLRVDKAMRLASAIGTNIESLFFEVA